MNALAKSDARQRAVSGFIICSLSELDGVLSAGVRHVVSIRDPGHPMPADILRLPQGQYTEFLFHDIIEVVAGRTEPNDRNVVRLLDLVDTLDLRSDANHGGPMVVHCHMGISRSTAAVATMLMKLLGPTHETDVFERLATIRPQAWPNSRIIDIADNILSLEGRFSAALRHFLAQQTMRHPGTIPLIRASGRDAEVDIASQSRVASEAHSC